MEDREQIWVGSPGSALRVRCESRLKISVDVSSEPFPCTRLPKGPRPALSGGKERGEFPKLSCVQIRDSPVIHPALRPVEKIVTAPRTCRWVGVVARRSGFDKQVNGMFVPPINKRDHSAAMEIIEASALKRKASRRQVTHFRREVDLAIKPGLDCVLVGRNHIHQVS